MAKGEKSGNYEILLEQRHLIGVFFAVVLLCAVFFTLGFVLGRDRAQAALAAKTSDSPPAAKVEDKTGAAAPKDLTFFDLEGKRPKETVPAQPTAAASSADKSASPPAKLIFLQVGAFADPVQARSLAQRLLNLGFPVTIQPPNKDRLHRVQVGPYESAELAEAAEGRLKAQGFKNILRR